MKLIILQSAMAGGMQNLFLIGMMAVAFIFFVILPQRKKQKETKAMQDSLKTGDKVQTAGGFHATVVSVDADGVMIELNRGVVAKIEKSFITTIVPKA
jgi:preprotein translocase subunit YajC